MTFKEQLESNPVWFASGIIIAGFIAGYSVSQALIGHTPISTEANWQKQAQDAGWILKADCAAYPLKVTISAPGDGSSIPFSTYGSSSALIKTAVVIQTNRPLPEANAVGYIWNQTGSPNYYVVMPSLTSDENRKVFREEYGVELPFKPDGNAPVTLRAFVTDDAKKIGETYSSIDQVKASDPNVVFSEPLSLNFHPE